MLKPNAKTLNNKYGMTLIEIVCALAILGIICMVFLSMFGTGLKGIYFAGHKSKATFMAQSEIDVEILNIAPSNAPAFWVDFFDVSNPAPGDTPALSRDVSGNIIRKTVTVSGRSAVMETYVP